ncbi:hypothetical protein G3I74_13885 [Wenzhouxiangella sp. C33]|uniref:Uncharacterized protein n=1 Tax=Wenzhouxiangella limi TaxID=2707351 RepID=A0A845VI09_9GAMM|nr:hypothetical protein [Wenzhouxiangella limi]
MEPAVEPATEARAAAAPSEADRAAILAMAGEYVVTFAFDETVALAEGYERKAAKRSGASEVVILIEDEPDRIVLQHLLLVGGEDGGEVIKHWRQDWTWEASHRLEFLDDQTWRKVPVDPETTRGAWTQCVYEVSDAPRYCGTGRWNHRYGHATWTSDRSWRPLPRREYTTREDYTALNVENRHTITPEGWTHEQDNSKVVRVDGDTEQVLVREFGFNNYIATDEVDFTPVYEYWEETSAYWAEVRAIWQHHFDNGGVVLDTEVDGMPIIDGLFALAEQVREGQAPQRAEIDQVFERYVIPMAPQRQLADQATAYRD